MEITETINAEEKSLDVDELAELLYNAVCDFKPSISYYDNPQGRTQVLRHAVNILSKVRVLQRPFVEKIEIKPVENSE